MHELSIATAVLDIAQRHAEGRRVTAVRLRVGALRQVVPSSLAFAWEVLTREGPCAGAVLEQEPVPALARCPACGDERALDEPLLGCPACGGRVEVLAGDELEVESIEVEEGAVPCTG
jgi:hydrogenase nickel incorporation protein HypA/HybF